MPTGPLSAQRRRRIPSGQWPARTAAPSAGPGCPCPCPPPPASRWGRWQSYRYYIEGSAPTAGPATSSCRCRTPRKRPLKSALRLQNPSSRRSAAGSSPLPCGRRGRPPQWGCPAPPAGRCQQHKSPRWSESPRRDWETAPAETPARQDPRRSTGWTR